MKRKVTQEVNVVKSGARKTRDEQIRRLKTTNLGNLIDYQHKCPECSGVLFLTGKNAGGETFRYYGCKSVVHLSIYNKLTVVETRSASASMM